MHGAPHKKKVASSIRVQINYTRIIKVKEKRYELGQLDNKKKLVMFSE